MYPHAAVDFSCYNASAYTLVRGNSHFTIRCNLTQDNVVEMEEDFVLALSTTTGFNVTLEPNETRVVITDDDSKLPLTLRVSE